MRTSSLYRYGLISTGAGLLAVASALAAEPAAGAWARTVALPTACYASQDQFAATNSAKLAVVADDASKQKEINDQLSKSWGPKEGEDPMAMAARIQEAMMRDPEAAMKMMQGTGAADPEAAQAAVMQRLERESQMQEEGNGLIKRYQAAVKAALVPARAHLEALRKRMGLAGEGWGVGETASDAAYAEYDAIKREADQAYAGMCPQWWGATGSMQAFMKRYKDYLVAERIPYDEKADSQILSTLALYGVDARSYKSVATLDAVHEYMKMAERLYAEREQEPRCTATTCKDVGGI